MTSDNPTLDAPPPAKWWAPFGRPLTWLAIIGFAVLSAVVQSLGLPEVWSTLALAALLAICVAIVTRATAPWAPLTVFLAVIVTQAVLRVGGLTAFLVSEVALLGVAIYLWARKAPKPG